MAALKQDHCFILLLRLTLFICVKPLWRHFLPIAMYECSCQGVGLLGECGATCGGSYTSSINSDLYAN